MKKGMYWGFLGIVLLTIVGSVPSAHAGGQNRAGTAAAPELLITPGARYVAMGGAPVALATGVEAIFWNSAGVDRVEKSVNAMFSHRTYIADISFNYLAVSGKFDFGSVALSLRSWDVGDIKVTTENAPDGTGEIFNPTYFVLGATYSRQLSDRVSIGFSANFISESFGQVSASGVAFDAGVQYRDLLAIRGIDVGVTVKNIGPAVKYEGPGLWVNANAVGSQRGNTLYKIEAAPFELPSVVEIGVAYRYTIDPSSTLSLSSTFQNNNFAYDEYRIGAEYGYDQMFFVRAGYLLGVSATSDRPNIFQDADFPLSLGAGVTFKEVGNTEVSIDYAFVPVKYFDSNHVIGVRIGF